MTPDPDTPPAAPAPPAPTDSPAAPAPAAPPDTPHVSDTITIHPRPGAAPRSRLWNTLRHVLQVVIPVAILWILWEELNDISLRAVRAAIAGAQVDLLILAALTAIAAVLATGLYDVLAFPHTPTQRSARRWGLGTLFFCWTNFVALGPVGVPFLRLHWYGRAGMPAAEVIRGVARLYVGMGAGLAAWTLAAVLPLTGEAATGLGRSIVALVLAPLIAGAAGFIRSPFRARDRAGTPLRTMLLLGLVGGIDWGAVLVSFSLTGHAVGADFTVAQSMRVLFIGQLIGLVSMVPGGLGTADGAWILQLSRAGIGSGAATALVLLFRLCFYIVPWLISLLAIGVVIYLQRTSRNRAAA